MSEANKEDDMNTQIESKMIQLEKVVEYYKRQYNTGDISELQWYKKRCDILKLLDKLIYRVQGGQ